MGSSSSKQEMVSKKNEIMENRVNVIKTRIKSRNVQTAPQRQTNDLIDEFTSLSVPNIHSIATSQIERRDAQLTKADLIAIVVALKPEYSDRIMHLNMINVPDLRFIIRNIIYEPNNYIPEKQPLQIVDAELLPSDPPIYQTVENSMPIYYEVENQNIK